MWGGRGEKLYISQSISARYDSLTVRETRTTSPPQLRGRAPLHTQPPPSYPRREELSIAYRTPRPLDHDFHFSFCLVLGLGISIFLLLLILLLHHPRPPSVHGVFRLLPVLLLPLQHVVFIIIVIIIIVVKINTTPSIPLAAFQPGGGIIFPHSSFIGDRTARIKKSMEREHDMLGQILVAIVRRQEYRNMGLR